MADRGRFLEDVIYESQEIMGPGWLMFFTESIRVKPPSGGGSGSDTSKLRAQQLRELDLEESDMTDIIEITLHSGILD